MNSLLNTKGLDITKPADFAKFVTMAKEVQTQLDQAWGFVEQQMIDGGVTKVQGDWGSISFNDAELLTITDATALDPAVTKAALDTKKVRAYREVMGELPAGVGTRTITKFVKRVK